jgi:alpha,alpha-trehalose-phosphate synthase [UDP-forming]
MREQSETRDTDTQPGSSGGIDKRLLPNRLLVVSNRLPYQIRVEGERVRLEQGIGGLVTALDPVLRYTGGLWIGWTGSHTPVPAAIKVDEHAAGPGSYELRPLDLTEKEVSQFYLGYANRGLWPLLHYFQEHCEFNEDEWQTYKDVNQKFARKVIDEYRENDFIWIHDYHLMLVPNMIRQEIPEARIGFFLHVPFPAAELFQVDLHAREILEGLLGADLLGFQTPAYVRNFIRTVAEMTDHGYSVSNRWVRIEGRYVRVGSFPISIDCDHFIELAGKPETDETVRKIRDNYRADYLAIGVDRLDYTKGILERLRAIEIMLERHRDIQGNFTFIQLSAPSRTKVHAYQELRGQIEQLIGRINGRFGGRGCLPIDYRYQGHSQEELVAFYRAADVALVTPLRDGMNLVAKEYVISKLDDDGCLVLSQFAGTSRELRDAVLVNPYHPQSMAEGIYRALTLPAEEKREAMRRMRELVRRNDIYWWLEQFLRAQQDALRDR